MCRGALDVRMILGSSRNANDGQEDESIVKDSFDWITNFAEAEQGADVLSSYIH